MSKISWRLEDEMPQFWIIFCKYCGKNTTVGKRPNKGDTIRTIHCSLCNRVIYASQGKFRYIKPVPVEQPEVDLLGIKQ